MLNTNRFFGRNLTYYFPANVISNTITGPDQGRQTVSEQDKWFNIGGGELSFPIKRTVSACFPCVAPKAILFQCSVQLVYFFFHLRNIFVKKKNQKSVYYHHSPRGNYTILQETRPACNGIYIYGSKLFTCFLESKGNSKSNRDGLNFRDGFESFSCRSLWYFRRCAELRNNCK